ncbi:MAG: DUF433 domain-containing protein [Bacteroidota bacterium]
MNFDQITSDPDILGGKPCIKGTRISVELILEWVASGASVADIHASYNHLEKEAIRQAIQYAAHFMKNEIILEVKPAG